MYNESNYKLIKGGKMDFKKVTKELSVIVVGGKKYLGVYDDKNSGVMIANAIRYSGISSIKNWFEKANVNDLTELHLGASQGFTKRELNESEKANVVYCLALMENVKKNPIQHVENELFSADFIKSNNAINNIDEEELDDDENDEDDRPKRKKKLRRKY